jgi:peptidoglycan/LPS O-acetylase OafA/YrhL
LLLLWPVGLLFPPPVPLGLGQIFGALQQWALSAVEGTPAQAWWETWTDTYGLSSVDSLSPAAEWGVTVLGLLVPCLVAFTIAPRGWRRVLLVLGAAVLGFAATTLSTALNFGPDHALAWRTLPAVPGLVGGVLAALLLSALPMRVAAGFGLVALTVLVTLVAQAPSDPYYADSLQSWEQGRFIRFHGVALWIGKLWPYIAAVYLLSRLGAAEQSSWPATRPAGDEARQ